MKYFVISETQLNAIIDNCQSICFIDHSVSYLINSIDLWFEWTLVHVPKQLPIVQTRDVHLPKCLCKGLKWISDFQFPGNKFQFDII